MHFAHQRGERYSPSLDLLQLRLLLLRRHRVTASRSPTTTRSSKSLTAPFVDSSQSLALFVPKYAFLVFELGRRVQSEPRVARLGVRREIVPIVRVQALGAAHLKRKRDGLLLDERFGGLDFGEFRDSDG